MEKAHRQGSPQATGDRRVEGRTPHRSVLVMPYGENLEYRFESAELVECSAHGIGILLNHPLAVGGNFLLKLQHRGRNLLVLYTVRHSRPDEDGQYRIGAEYAGEISGPNEAMELEAIFEALMAT